VGQVAINGTLIGGPVQVGAGFPQAIFTTPLQTSVSPKPFSAASGVMQRRIAVAAPGFVDLQAAGPFVAVQRADLLYLRCDAQLILRLSNQDPLNPLGPPLVVLLPVSGLVIIEFPASSPLVLLEAQGSATVEYAASGQ
jgi:hypothetical protein